MTCERVECKSLNVMELRHLQNRKLLQEQYANNITNTVLFDLPFILCPDEFFQRYSAVITTSVLTRAQAITTYAFRSTCWLYLCSLMRGFVCPWPAVLLCSCWRWAEGGVRQKFVGKTRFVYTVLSAETCRVAFWSDKHQSLVWFAFFCLFYNVNMLLYLSFSLSVYVTLLYMWQIIRFINCIFPRFNLGFKSCGYVFGKPLYTTLYKGKPLDLLNLVQLVLCKILFLIFPIFSVLTYSLVLFYHDTIKVFEDWRAFYFHFYILIFLFHCCR